MANFKRLVNFRGDEIYINVDLVQVVGPARDQEAGKALVHFGGNDAFLVQGDPVDVMDVLWPARDQPRARG